MDDGVHLNAFIQGMHSIVSKNILLEEYYHIPVSIGNFGKSLLVMIM
jgi:hypothetical protein